MKNVKVSTGKPGKSESISGMKKIIKKYRAVLIDAWGVIHDGANLYSGVAACLGYLYRKDISVVVISNSAQRAHAVREKMVALGVNNDWITHVVSSGELVSQALSHKELPPDIKGSKYYYLGPDRSRGILCGIEYDETFSVPDADFIINTGASGAVDSVEHDRPVLKKAIQRNLPMICANPDLVAIRDGQEGICAGALAQLYEELGATSVWWVGKPYRNIYQTALDLLPGIPTRQILAIGDSMRTDIDGACQVNLHSLLVCEGIHRKDIKLDSEISTRQFLEGYEFAPTYIIKSLSL